MWGEIGGGEVGFKLFIILKRNFDVYKILFCFNIDGGGGVVVVVLIGS